VKADRLEDALILALGAKEKGRPNRLAWWKRCGDLPGDRETGIVPDLVTDQTSAHDALMGYVPAGLPLDEALELRKKDPKHYVQRSMESMAIHVKAMLELQKKGSVVFDYGNNIRAQAFQAGVKDAFNYPGFVPAYVRPLFCEGKALSDGLPFPETRGHHQDR